MCPDNNLSIVFFITLTRSSGTKEELTVASSSKKELATGQQLYVQVLRFDYIF